nr:immunoglobulin superfamily member 10-like [Pocillopora verrucosa]
MEQMKQCRKDRDKYRKAWIKNRTVINHYPEEYKLSVNRTLSVLKMSPKYDGAVFLCIGEIEHHEALENTTIIQIIKEKPVIKIKSQKPSSVIEGSTLYLNCVATGFPRPRVTWVRIRDGQVLQNRTNDEATSLVRNFTKCDEGEYRCTAKNRLESDNYILQVIVINKIPSSEAPDPSDSPPSGGCSKVGFGTAIKNPIILSLIIALSMICVILSNMLLKRKCKDAQIGRKFRNACGRMCRWRRTVYVVSDTELENKAAP